MLQPYFQCCLPLLLHAPSLHVISHWLLLTAAFVGLFRLVPETAHLIPAQTLGAIAGATEAGAIGCVHSNWGPTPPCNHSTGGANELLTCTEQEAPFQPRAVWHVFAAYANSSGLRIPVHRHCDDCTALCSSDPVTRSIHLLLGYYNGWKSDPATGHSVALPALPWRILRVELAGMKVDTSATGSVSVKVSTIPDTGPARLVAPLPMYTRAVPLMSDGRLVLELNASLNAVLTVEIMH